MKFNSKILICFILSLVFGIGTLGVRATDIVSPDSEVTLKEAIALAAKARASYYEETITVPQDQQWCDVYLDYAVDEGIVGEDEFDDLTRPANRYEIAVLLEKAMPDGYFNSINNVTEIPDVSKNDENYNALLTLYKAGIVMGTDKYGNFYPENNINRVEMDTIINRIAVPENRIQKSLYILSHDDAYSLAYAATYENSRVGVASGWVLDNRAGEPRTSLYGGYHMLTDISTAESSAMIRDFNKTSTGKFTLVTNVELFNGFDGFALEYRNEEGNTVYKLVTNGGEWNIVDADGDLTAITSDADSNKKFSFVITVDLDNLVSTTTINGVNYGEHALCVDADEANIYNFRFTTDGPHTLSAYLGSMEITANYAVYDNFSWGADGWTGSDLSTNNVGELVIKPSHTATREFTQVSGTVIGNFMAFLNGPTFEYKMKNSGSPLVTLTVNGTQIFANGQSIYTYTSGIWYKFRVELDAFNHTATIYINGRDVAEINLANEATGVDEISFKNTGSADVKIDRVTVFKKQDYTETEYVPRPQKPAGADNYTIGINVCSLWRNGYTSLGWSCISPYDDFKSVLGYYDEGVPETADWEIKYMVEHGIDFQAFCWYPSANGVIKGEGEHFYEGYMFAEYSDMMNYAILWEASSTVPSLQNFKTYYVPYMIEHFFKDDRYMTIDNKPVLCIYAGQPDDLSTKMGGNANVKAALDYLETEVKKLGFDGMIYLMTGVQDKSQISNLDAMGFDGNYAYNWGTAGSSLATNKSKNTSIAEASTTVYTVPTISVGFNSLPWHGIRYSLMKYSDFKVANEWVKNEYLPKYAKESWQENFVMISTWNEYGEGTYIMPTDTQNGFGYLDALREVYTSASATSSVNVVPSEQQAYRINHLYPQYARLLRSEGNYKPSEHQGEKVVDYTINYSASSYSNAISKGFSFNAIQEMTFSNDGIGGVVYGDAIVEKKNLNIDTTDIRYIKLTISVPENTTIKVYFKKSGGEHSENSMYSVKAVTEEVPELPEEVTDEVIMDVGSLLEEDSSDIMGGTDTDETGLKEYELYIETATNKNWNGTITALRVDPGQTDAGVIGNEFLISKVEFLSCPYERSRTLTVNGIETEMPFYPEETSNGETLIAFDPSIGLDFLLNSYYTWDKESGRIVIEINGHKVVYTAGLSTYVLDGVQKQLGYEFYLQDGLPMIPIEMLCEDVGYECTVSDESIDITTTEYQRIAEIEQQLESRTEGCWEFDINGHTENWRGTDLVGVASADGNLIVRCLQSTNDPQILIDKLNWNALDYTKFKIKCRYKHNASGNSSMQVFFATSTAAMSGTNSFTISHNSKDTEGEWVTYTYDLSNLSSWTGTITSIRIDPFVATGEMDIDYIRFTAE